jgi:hypothetical protein
VCAIAIVLINTSECLGEDFDERKRDRFWNCAFARENRGLAFLLPSKKVKDDAIQFHKKLLAAKRHTFATTESCRFPSSARTLSVRQLHGSDWSRGSGARRRHSSIS